MINGAVDRLKQLPVHEKDNSYFDGSLDIKYRNQLVNIYLSTVSNVISFPQINHRIKYEGNSECLMLQSQYKKRKRGVSKW